MKKVIRPQGLFFYGLVVVMAVMLSACDKNSPLMEASMKGEHESVRNLLAQSSTDIDGRNAYGWTALMHASRLGDAELVTMLLDAGADSNAVDESQWTSLMRASLKGHVDVASLLLARGANLSNIDENGYSALHWAAHQGHIRLVKLLVDAGADIKLKNKGGATAENVAENEKQADVAMMLRKIRRERR